MRNFRQVGGQFKYRKWGLWEEGDMLVGKFVQETMDNYKKPSYHIEVEEVQFEDMTDAPKQGEIFALNSAGQLDKAMAQVEKGDFVKVIYKGIQTIEKGPYAGKEAHSMAIFISPANSDNKYDESDSTEVL